MLKEGKDYDVNQSPITELERKLNIQKWFREVKKNKKLTWCSAWTRYFPKSLTHLVLAMSLCSRYHCHYHPHFIDEGTEAQDS